MTRHLGRTDPVLSTYHLQLNRPYASAPQRHSFFLAFVFRPALAQNQPERDPVLDVATATPAAFPGPDSRPHSRGGGHETFENDKKQRDYTYIQRQEEHKLDGNERVKSSESRTFEIMVLYAEQVRTPDRPGRQAALPERMPRLKEDEKTRKLIGEAQERKRRTTARKRLENRRERAANDDCKFVGEGDCRSPTTSASWLAWRILDAKDLRDRRLNPLRLRAPL